MRRPNTVRISLDIPAALDARLQGATPPTRLFDLQLTLGHLARFVAEELPREPGRVSLLLVPVEACGVITDVTSDRAPIWLTSNFAERLLANPQKPSNGPIRLRTSASK